MSGAYIASGSIALQKDSPVTIDIGPVRARFSESSDPPSHGIEFGVTVPFGVGPGVVSTSNLRTEGETGDFQLLVTFTGAGAKGEFQAAVYSLYQH